MSRHTDRIARVAGALAGTSRYLPSVVVMQRRAGHHENDALDLAARALYVQEYGSAPSGPAVVVQLEGNNR